MPNPEILLCSGLPLARDAGGAEVQKFRLTHNLFHLPRKSKFLKSLFCAIFLRQFCTKVTIFKFIQHLIRPGGDWTWPKAAISPLFTHALLRFPLTLLALLTPNLAHNFEGRALFFLFLKADLKIFKNLGCAAQKLRFYDELYHWKIARFWIYF
jgi:hypothetical protein